MMQTYSRYLISISMYTFIGIEPMVLMLLTPCSTNYATKTHTGESVQQYLLLVPSKNEFNQLKLRFTFCFVFPIHDKIGIAISKSFCSFTGSALDKAVC